MKTWNGRCAGAGVPPAGQGAAEAHRRAEFRNTHFSYTLGADGVEKFVSTPELQSEDSIGGDPLEPGQVWTISPGGQDEHPGLYRIEVNEGRLAITRSRFAGTG
jgi:predicted ATP-dependent Lon-type protease